MTDKPDNLDRASQAGEVASAIANSVADSGILGEKAIATTRKVGLGLSLAAGILSAFKAIFGKKKN